MEFELKPCPFCGCKVNFNRVKSGWNKIIGEHSDFCPIQGNTMLTWSEMDDAPIIEKWNNRINMHDELVNMLQDVKDFTDWYYGGKVDGSRPKKPLNEIAKNIGELLERCK